MKVLSGPPQVVKFKFVSLDGSGGLDHGLFDLFCARGRPLRDLPTHRPR